MANVERLKLLKETILRNESQWCQRNWAKRTVDCGTSMCMAGWASALAGQEFQWTQLDLLNLTDFGVAMSGVLVNGEYPADFARKWLGLTEDQAEDLFWDTDNASALERLDDYISEGGES